MHVLGIVGSHSAFSPISASSRWHLPLISKHRYPGASGEFHILVISKHYFAQGQDDFIAHPEACQGEAVERSRHCLSGKRCCEGTTPPDQIHFSLRAS